MATGIIKQMGWVPCQKPEVKLDNLLASVLLAVQHLRRTMAKPNLDKHDHIYKYTYISTEWSCETLEITTFEKPHKLKLNE